MAHSMPLYLVDICPHHRCVLRTYSVWWIPQKFLRILSTLSSHGALLDNQSSSDCSYLHYIYILHSEQDSEEHWPWRWPSFCGFLWLVEWQVRMCKNTAWINTFASNTVLRLRQNSTEVVIPRNYLANLTWEDSLFFNPIDATLTPDTCVVLPESFDWQTVPTRTL